MIEGERINVGWVADHILDLLADHHTKNEPKYGLVKVYCRDSEMVIFANFGNCNKQFTITIEERP